MHGNSKNRRRAASEGPQNPKKSPLRGANLKRDASVNPMLWGEGAPQISFRRRRRRRRLPKRKPSLPSSHFVWFRWFLRCVTNSAELVLNSAELIMILQN